MANLGSLIYRIRAKNQQFKQGMKENRKEVKKLDKEVEKSQGTLKKYSEGFKKAGIALTAFGAIVTGVSFKLAKMASDANEIQSRFNHVFGELSKDANKWAENFAESFGQSRSEIKDMMAQLQDTLVPMGVAEDKAFKLNKQITQLAIDMSSFANVPLAKAMEDIQSAIVDQSRPMRKYGSVLTQTRVKQYALKKGIVETDRELTEQEKIVARVQLMFEDMTKATGDYKRTQDSFANQLRETKNLLKNIGETIGENVLPVFSDLLGHVKDLLEWFEDLPDATQKVISKFMVWSGIIAGIVGPLALIVGYLPQIASGFSMIYGAMNPYFLAGGAIILGLTAIYNLVKDIKEETDLLTTATEELTEAQLKEKQVMLENKISRLEDLIERGGEEDSILGPGLSTDLAERRLKNYREQLIKTEEALSEYKETAAKTPSETSTSGGGDGGTSERPGWLGPGPETPEVDEEKAKEIAQRIMDMGYETRIAEMEGLQKELMQLDLRETQELRGIEDQTLITAIEKKYEAQREAAMERYAEIWNQQRDKEMRFRYQHKEDLEEGVGISLERYKSYLEARLNQYEVLSTKWISIKQELMSLDEEPEDTFGIEDIRENYNAALEELKRKNKVYGESFDFAEAKADLLKQTIDEIIALGEEGMDSEFLDELVATYKELTSEDEETVESFNWMTDALVDIGYEIETANQAFQEWKNSLIDGLSNAIAKGENLADVFANIADQIAAMVIKQSIVKPMTNAVLGWAGLSTGHSGGLVTTAGIIPEMHNGGLANDEIVAKLQTGERVLSREENKAYESGRSGTTNILIQAVDSKSFQQMLAENRATVTQLSVEDIMKNGQLRKALKQYL